MTKESNATGRKADGGHTTASEAAAVVISVLIVLASLSIAGVGAGAVAVLVWTDSLAVGASEPMAFAAALAILFVGAWLLNHLYIAHGWAQEIFAAVMGALGHGDATHPRA